MNFKLSYLALLAGVVFQATLATPVAANAPAFLQLTGKVTGLPGGNQIEVNGRKYTVAAGGATERVKSLHIGDVIDLKLEGTVAGHSSTVVNIDAHPAH